MERGVFDQLLLVFQWLCVMTVDSVDQSPMIIEAAIWSLHGQTTTMVSSGRLWTR